MNKLKSLLLLLIPVLSIPTACNSLTSGHAIKGTVAEAANLQVTLDLAHFDRTNVSLGRATCDPTGAFEIKTEKPWEEGLYRLKIGAKQIYFILDGKEGLIEISGNLNTIDRMEMQVKGSETLNCYAGIIQDLFKNQLQSADQAMPFIERACTPLMKAFLTTQLLGQNATPFLTEFKAQGEALNKAMPGTKYATDFSNIVNKIENAATQPQAVESIQVGMMAPEISQPDPNGKIRKLSSLKGKVVLLDFWASWCGPCRKANPHVVDMYNKYKGKGFEVFSVSLDKQDGKQNWLNAIQQDGLVWDNHVSDLKYWDSAPAATYGVRSIPKTFLIGKDGKIVAVNPRTNLEEEILKVL